MPQFRTLSSNKFKLELLSRDLTLRDISNMVLSGMVINDELISPRIKQNESPLADLPELSSWIEEADSRIPPPVKWSAEHGCERKLMFSNDADSVSYALRFLSDFEHLGLRDLWIHYRRPKCWIPIHKIKQRIGDKTAKVVIKAHVLTGNDHLSKVGTKYAALHYNPGVVLPSIGLKSRANRT